MFDTYPSQLEQEGEEIVNLPMFYRKSPFLAHTVIYSKSDIEKLDQQPKLFEQFKKSSIEDLEQLYK